MGGVPVGEPTEDEGVSSLDEPTEVIAGVRLPVADGSESPAFGDAYASAADLADIEAADGSNESIVPLPPERIDDEPRIDAVSPRVGMAETPQTLGRPTWDLDDPAPVEPLAEPQVSFDELALSDRPAVSDDDPGAEVSDPAHDVQPIGPKTPLFKRELRLPRKAGRSARPATDVVGLRIGSTQLAAARVRTVAGRHEVVQIAREPLRSGIVVAGEVREPDALAAALKAFFEAHNLPRKAVRLGVASNRIGVRLLEVPVSGDPKLFDNVIRFRAQEVVPIPLAEASLDQIVLGEYATPAGPMRKILVAFAHRDLVDRYAESCKRAHLKLIGIDFDAFALLRAVDETRGDGVAPDRATVAVSIGHERTIFAVAEGEMCDFTRVLEWGGASLDASLAEVLNMAPAETTPIKHGLTLGIGNDSTSLTNEQLDAARRAIRAELEVLARELLASLQFYQSRPGSLAIGEILLAGGGAQLEGVEAELERLIGVPVRSADPFARAELGKKVEWPIEPGSLPIAVGLGMAA
jgi:type IV pilus assembly protein PilM